MANITDKITDVRNAARPNSARVITVRTTGGTSLACDSLTGWPTASKVHFVTYRIDTNNDPIGGTQLDCYGIVSGSTITQFAVVDGTDGGNAIGDVVEMLPTAAWGQDLADALTVGHERTGVHKANLPLTTPIIADHTNATHTHANAAGGGQLTGSAITTGSQLADRLLNPYKFSVYQASDLVLSSGVTTKAHLDTEEFDTGNNFDSVTNFRFVVPINGFYQISAQIGLTSAGASAGVGMVGYLYKNGSSIISGSVIDGSGSGNRIPKVVFSKLFQLVAGDYFELFGQVNEGGRTIQGAQSVTFMSGFLVSAT